MSNLKSLTRVLAAAAVLGVSMVGARAQAVYGTDYLSFQGSGVVLDNPTSPACQSINVNFGSTYVIVYRWTNNPSLVADALSFIIDDKAVSRLVSTSGPNFSLNGTSNITWSFINRHADFNSGIGAATTTMTILSGINTPVSLSTGNIKIVNATIPNFPANTTAGCTVNNFHAAAVAIPQ